MKRFLVLFAVLSGSVMASSIGACVSGSLSGYIGNACSLGDQVFDNFAYSGNVDAANINVDFQMAGGEYQLILEPITGAGFFTTLSFVDRVTVQAGVAPNIPPAVYQIDGVDDQSDFSSAPGTSGQLVVANSPGPSYTLAPGTDTGGPASFAPTDSVTTTSTLTGPGGTGAASPGLSSFQLGYIQIDPVVPEPAPFALIGTGLLCLGLLRKRSA